MMSLGYFIVTAATYFADDTGHISSWWIVGSYFFQSLAELLTAALGTAMISKLAPQKITGLMMGVWFLAMSVGGVLAGKFASLTAVPQGVTDPFLTLHIYQHAFTLFGITALTIGIIACFFAPMVTRLVRETHAPEDVMKEAIL